MYGIFFTCTTWCAWASPSELFLARIFQTRSGALSPVHMPAPRLASGMEYADVNGACLGQLLWLLREKCGNWWGCRLGILELGIRGCHSAESWTVLCVCLWMSCMKVLSTVVSESKLLFEKSYIKVSIFSVFKCFSCFKKHFTCVYHMCPVSEESIKRCQIPWSCRYRQFWVTIHVLGTKLGPLLWVLIHLSSL